MNNIVYVSAYRLQAWRASLLAVSLALSLGGCLGLGGKVPPTLLNLTTDHAVAAGSGSSGTYRTAIAVLDPVAELRVDVTRVPVRVDDSTVAYLKGAQWVERPSHLFRHLLAETLRARGKQLVIEGDPGTAALKLGGRLIDMGFDARTGSVLVRFEAVKERPNGALETRRFESVVSGVAAQPGLVGIALNQAANTVAGQVADWVG
jgi:cholesterol transport system auxiliary component